jgi:hypothetical protein
MNVRLLQDAHRKLCLLGEAFLKKAIDYLM